MEECLDGTKARTNSRKSVAITLLRLEDLPADRIGSNARQSENYKWQAALHTLKRVDVASIGWDRSQVSGEEGKIYKACAPGSQTTQNTTGGKKDSKLAGRETEVIENTPERRRDIKQPGKTMLSDVKHIRHFMRSIPYIHCGNQFVLPPCTRGWNAEVVNTQAPLTWPTS